MQRRVQYRIERVDQLDRDVRFAYILLCLRDIVIHARIRVLETRGSRGSNGDESRIGQTFLSLLRCFLAHEQ